MARELPRRFNWWPKQEFILRSPADCQRAYEVQHFAGTFLDRDSFGELVDFNERLTGFRSIEQAAAANSWEDVGKGSLSIPFVFALKHFPGSFPGPAQERGDCVGHALRNAMLSSYSTEIEAGVPDEVTGKVEVAPEISAEGLKNGAFSCEVPYWYRGYDGHGWDCGSAARVAQNNAGLVVRKNYPELELDLTRYTGALSELYGRRAPPSVITQLGQRHLIRAFAPCNGREARRDACAAGYSLLTCGMESFSNRRGQGGVAARTRAGWAHAMGCFGFDDRPIAYQTFGDSVELYPNSWGIWNTGDRDIIETAAMVPPAERAALIAAGLVNARTGNLMIPEGSMWVRSRDVARRTVLAASSVNGFPAKRLPRLFKSILDR